MARRVTAMAIAAGAAVLQVGCAVLQVGCAAPPPAAVQALGPPRKTMRIQIPLVATDRTSLACASNVRIGSLRCGHTAAGQPWPADRAKPRDLVLQPYTPTGADAPDLIAAAMLWDDPDVLALAAEEKGRFIVSCELAVHGEAADLRAQWEPGGQWFPASTYGSDPPLVGVLSDCHTPRGPHGR
jgi:hypothetical protein